MFLIKEGTTPGEGTPKETKDAIKKWMEKEGFVIRTEKEDESYVTAKVKDEVDTIMAERNQQVTDDIKELTGSEPKPNEKWHVFMKRAVKESTDVLNSKISQLEKSNKGGDNDEEITSLKEQVKDLEKMVADKEKEKTELQESFETEKKTETVKSRIQKSIDAMADKFKDVDKTILNDSIEMRKSKIMDSFEVKEVDGVEMLYDKKTNKPIRGNDGQPLSLEDKVSETFNDLIDESKNRKPGGGTGKPGSGNPGSDGGEKKWESIEVQAKTKTALYDELRDGHKLDPESKDFNEAFENLGKEMPLR